jgi:transcriptional regulator with GAF, ATPase, and Fis domain
VTLFGGEVVRLGGTLLVFRDALPLVRNEDLHPDADIDPAVEAVGGDARNKLVAPYGVRSLRHDLAAIERVRPKNVLVHGETGTGKERVAHAVAVALGMSTVVSRNAAIIAPERVAADLFGSEVGGFTGAVKTLGAVREAAVAKAALFLDEIGDLPGEAQAALLRLLQDGEVQPVGGKVVHVTVPLVAATHRNLDALVHEGKFRADLHARLEMTVHIPPLRERPEDVFAIFCHLWGMRAKVPVSPEMLDTGAVEALVIARHPQNVRGLARLVSEVAKSARERLHLRREIVDKVFGKEPRAALCPAAVKTAFESARPAKGSHVSDEVAFQWLRERAVGPFCEVGTFKRFRRGEHS